MKTVRGPYKIHGGKYYLCKWIIDHFPADYEHLHYVEPFFGAGNAFFNKTPATGGKHEVVNDINNGIANILYVLRDESEEFISRLKKIKYNEKNFKLALENQKTKDYFENAINEFILRRMSRDGLKKAFAWSNRQRGGIPGDVNAWKTIMKVLPSLSHRLNGSYIFNKPATDIIKGFDSEDTLIYCDPPYMPDTRVTPNAYEDEMTIEQHEILLDALLKCKGKVIISGYPSSLYSKKLKGWKVVKNKIVNHSSQQKTKKLKTEVIWLNY